MNIYFACSITGGREFEPLYESIVDALLAEGHEIPTAHLAKPGTVIDEHSLAPRFVYERDIEWIENCDALIAEVSVPSHGVGYEIGYALTLGKKVFCLHHVDRKVSKMITGNPHPNLYIQIYADDIEAISFVRNLINSLHQ